MACSTRPATTGPILGGTTARPRRTHPSTRLESGQKTGEIRSNPVDLISEDRGSPLQARRADIFAASPSQNKAKLRRCGISFPPRAFSRFPFALRRLWRQAPPLAGISWIANPTAGRRRFFRTADFPVCRIAGFPTRRPFARLTRPPPGLARCLKSKPRRRLKYFGCRLCLGVTRWHTGLATKTGLLLIFRQNRNPP